MNLQNQKGYPGIILSNPKLQEMMEREKAQMKKENKRCAEKYDIPICFVNKNCDQATKQKYELGEKEWSQRNEKATLANKKYRRAKCWEICVQPPMYQQGISMYDYFNCGEFLPDKKCPPYCPDGWWKPNYRTNDGKKVRLETSPTALLNMKWGTGAKLIMGGIILYLILKK